VTSQRRPQLLEHVLLALTT